MHADAEVAQENPRVVLGMFLVNSTPASVLFDSGASHSFITSPFVAQHNIPISPMSRHMLVTSPGGELKPYINATTSISRLWAEISVPIS
jgi:hypothetical protein